MVQAFNPLEAGIHMTLDRLSNQEPVHIDDAWIETAGEEFKAALRKQLVARDDEFRLRASNIGRPLCQLQNEAKDEPRTRMPYNHVIRMLIGDSVEAITRLIIKAANVNVTGSRSKVELKVNNSIIKGEDDLEIDGAVWDVKSTSPFTFEHKWAHGWDSLFDDDTFGYVEQLYTYSVAQDKPMGGWIVINKSSGEVKVVPATPTPDQLTYIKEDISFKEQTITNDLPFKRCYVDEEETFYKKPTGNRILPMTCSFCSYITKCWPDAQYKPKALSKAQNKQMVWYTQYKEETK